jgi:hypothetical protein
MAPGPRLRRKSVRGAPRLAARWAVEVIWDADTSLHRAVVMRGVFYDLFMFYCFAEKWGLSLVIRGPSWLSPIVAPEPLRRCLLGTRRG